MSAQPWLIAALILAGGLGAVLRYLVDDRFRAALPMSPPLGTLAINLSGSIALGVLTGAALTGLAPEGLRLVLGVGFLGGYTTFSATGVETVRLAREGRILAAALYAVGGLLACVLGAAVGFAAGAALAGAVIGAG